MDNLTIIESYDEEIKTIATNFNEKKATCKTQNFYIFCILINYYSIIDSFYYLLLFDKILVLTKIFNKTSFILIYVL